MGLENNNKTCRNDIWDIIALFVYNQRRWKWVSWLYLLRR